MMHHQIYDPKRNLLDHLAYIKAFKREKEFGINLAYRW